MSGLQEREHLVVDVRVAGDDHHLGVCSQAGELQTAAFIDYTIPTVAELPLTPHRVWRAIQQAREGARA